MPTRVDLIHLRGRGTDVVVDLSHGAPVIVHWGAPLCGGADGPSATVVLDRPLVLAAPDEVAPISVVPEHGSGFPGRPGLLGCRRSGTGWAPRFRPAGHTLDGNRLSVVACDDVAGLVLTTTIELDHALTVRVDLANSAAR